MQQQLPGAGHQGPSLLSLSACSASSCWWRQTAPLVPRHIFEQASCWASAGLPGWNCPLVSPPSFLLLLELERSSAPEQGHFGGGGGLPTVPSVSGVWRSTLLRSLAAMGVCGVPLASGGLGHSWERNAYLLPHEHSSYSSQRNCDWVGKGGGRVGVMGGMWVPTKWSLGVAASFQGTREPCPASSVPSVCGMGAKECGVPRVPRFLVISFSAPEGPPQGLWIQLFCLPCSAPPRWGQDGGSRPLCCLLLRSYEQERPVWAEAGRYPLGHQGCSRLRKSHQVPNQGLQEGPEGSLWVNRTHPKHLRELRQMGSDAPNPPGVPHSPWISTSFPSSHLSLSTHPSSPSRLPPSRPPPPFSSPPPSAPPLSPFLPSFPPPSSPTPPPPSSPPTHTTNSPPHSRTSASTLSPE